jgi:ribosomal protein L20A (L18A)
MKFDVAGVSYHPGSVSFARPVARVVVTERERTRRSVFARCVAEVGEMECSSAWVEDTEVRAAKRCLVVETRPRQMGAREIAHDAAVSIVVVAVVPTTARRRRRAEYDTP